MDASTLLLTTAFRHRIQEPNVDAGYAKFVEIVGQPVGYDAFCDAVSACLRGRLIREPIRLPEGALQCHWHLGLTPAGVARARALKATVADDGSVNSTFHSSSN